MKTRILLLFSAIFLVAAYLIAMPDGRARIIFCDVGQGDAILVSRGFEQILVDTGTDNKKVLRCLDKYLAFWDKNIDLLIISHEDKDHFGGLADVEKNYKIGEIVYGVSQSKEFEQKSNAKQVRRNDIVRMGDIYFEVVNPEEKFISNFGDNDNSVAGILKYKDIRILLTGDVSEEVEKMWVWREMLTERIDVLKVAHHGSGHSTSGEFLDLIKPIEAVISVGKNSYGHPSGEVLERLEKRGVKVRRTDDGGDVVFFID